MTHRQRVPYGQPREDRWISEVPVTTGTACPDATVTNLSNGTTRSIQGVCAEDPSMLARILPWLLLAFLIVGPIATSVWLLRRLR